MDIALRDRFLEIWRRDFGGGEPPITFFYTDRDSDAPPVTPVPERRCFFAELARARAGENLRFGAKSFGCQGGRRYTGFGDRLRPKFEYFLSCGIPGRMEGERYKKTPELVRELMARATPFAAPAKYLVAKRWDRLETGDDPQVVVFFARPDVLAGLFTLAGFASADDDTVIAPFGAGCATIVQRPFLERDRPIPRAVLGSFDVSARPHIGADELSFALPFEKLAGMIADADESFLLTESWALIRERIESGQG